MTPEGDPRDDQKNDFSRNDVFSVNRFGFCVYWEERRLTTSFHMTNTVFSKNHFLVIPGVPLTVVNFRIAGGHITYFLQNGFVLLRSGHISVRISSYMK
jgi:hypothetical protein